MLLTTDTNRLDACGLAFENLVSSTLTMLTSTVRSGSSANGVSYASSMLHTSCQPTKISRDRRACLGLPTDLTGRPEPGPSRHAVTRRSDPRV